MTEVDLPPGYTGPGTCATCQRPLRDDGPVDDFCGEACAAMWQAMQAEPVKTPDCAHHFELDPVVDLSLHWTCRVCGDGIVTGWAAHLTLEETARLLTEQHGETFTVDPSAAARRAAEARADFVRRNPEFVSTLREMGIDPEVML